MENSEILYSKMIKRFIKNSLVIIVLLFILSFGVIALSLKYNKNFEINVFLSIALFALFLIVFSCLIKHCYKKLYELSKANERDNFYRHKFDTIKGIYSSIENDIASVSKNNLDILKEMFISIGKGIPSCSEKNADKLKEAISSIEKCITSGSEKNVEILTSIIPLIKESIISISKDNVESLNNLLKEIPEQLLKMDLSEEIINQND